MKCEDFWPYCTLGDYQLCSLLRPAVGCHHPNGLRYLLAVTYASSSELTALLFSNAHLVINQELHGQNSCVLFCQFWHLY